MYWYFYRSTIILNICVSILVAFFTGSLFLVVFPVCFATIGLFAVFLYKEVARPLEYFFYYNRGITKIKLFLFCMLINILPASLFLIFFFYVS